MRALLATIILFCSLVEFVRSDDNIYGPGGVNLGPNGDPEQRLQEIEQLRQQQEQFEQGQRQKRQEALAAYKSGFGLTLRPNYNGHYFVDGAVNNIPLVFAIDTGASLVTLPQQVASKAGIQCQNEAMMETANGRIKTCVGLISTLKFGDFSLTNVQCVIAAKLNRALLGNNVLTRFNISQQNGEMRISK